MTSPRPIVIVGLPRSGTTWTLRALRSAAGAHAVLEPDNEDMHPAAIHAKRQVGRYPVLEPGTASAAYRSLWEWALLGAHEDRRARLARRILGPGARSRLHEGRSDPITRLASIVAKDPRPAPEGVDGATRVLVKSIHAQLALEWLADEFEIDVLVLLRHPANVLASWMEVNLKDARNATLETRPEVRSHYLERWGVPLPGTDPIERMSWRIGLLTAALDEARSRHPEWRLRRHEELCADPPGQFRELYTDLGLPWGAPSEAFLEEHDTPGSGFAVDRVAAELPDSWRRRLDDDQVATLRRVLGWFPITSWDDEDFA